MLCDAQIGFLVRDLKEFDCRHETNPGPREPTDSHSPEFMSMPCRGEGRI